MIKPGCQFPDSINAIYVNLRGVAHFPFKWGKFLLFETTKLTTNTVRKLTKLRFHTSCLMLPPSFCNSSAGYQGPDSIFVVYVELSNYLFSASANVCISLPQCWTLFNQEPARMACCFIVLLCPLMWWYLKLIEHE